MITMYVQVIIVSHNSSSIAYHTPFLLWPCLLRYFLTYLTHALLNTKVHSVVYKKEIYNPAIFM